jgi:ornithine cyclodeaminase/alanine dehydrogenase-like protein (mu-crystallin family)
MSIGPDQVRQLVELDDLIAPVADAFRAASAGRARDEIVTMYPAATTADGDVYIKTSCSQGARYHVVKISPWFAANVAAGVPQGGLIALLDSTTGHTVALIDDQHRLTDLRTAAAGALLTRMLAPTQAGELVIVGTGTQAYWQTVAALRERPFEKVSIWGRSRDHADALVTRLARDNPHQTIDVATNLASAVHHADVVIATTSAREPLVAGSWLRAGQLVISVGSDDATKAELHPECLAQADLIVVDLRALAQRYGNVHRAIATGVLSADTPMVEVGELLARSSPRPHHDALSVATLVGLGSQDLATATIVAERWQAIGPTGGAPP